MVSKNNIVLHNQQGNVKIPHYGLRKLSVGVASVLLGTSVALTMTAKTAHADTVENSQGETESNNDVATPYQAQPVNSSENSASASSDQETDSIKTNFVQVSDLPAVQQVQKTVNSNDQNTNSDVEQSQKTVSGGSSVDNSYRQNLSQQAQHQVVSNEPAYRPDENHYGDLTSTVTNDTSFRSGNRETATLAQDGSSITIDDNIISNGHRVSYLTFKSSTFQAGDIYTIIIPDSYLESSSDVAKLQPQFGTTSVGYYVAPSGKQFWMIVDHFTSSGTVSQDIKLQVTDIHALHHEFDAEPNAAWSPYALITGKIRLYHGDVENTALDMNYQLPPIDMGHGIFSLDGYNADYPISNDQDYVLRFLHDNYVDSINIWDNWYGQVNHAFLDGRMTIDLPSGADQVVSLTSNTGTIMGTVKGDLVAGTFHVEKQGHQLVLTNFQFNEDAKLVLQQGRLFDYLIPIHLSVPQSELASGHYSFTIGDLKGSYSTQNKNISIPIDIPGATLSVINTSKDLAGNAISYRHVLNARDIGSGIYYSHSSVFSSNSIMGNYSRARTINAGNQTFVTVDPIVDAMTVIKDNIGDADYSLDVPDGFNLYRAIINDASDIGSVTLQLRNGQKFTFNSLDDLKRNSNYLADQNACQIFNLLGSSSTDNKFDLAKASSPIAKISIHYKNLTKGKKFGVTIDNNSYFRIFERYSSGAAVKPNDLLRFVGHISYQGGHYDNIPLDEMLMVQPDNVCHVDYLYVMNDQNSSLPGVSDAGSLKYLIENTTSADYRSNNVIHYEKPVIYMMVPDNAVLNSIDDVSVYNMDTDEPLKVKSISVVPMGNHKFIKVDCSNFDLVDFEIGIKVKYGNKVDSLSSTDSSPFFIASSSINSSDAFVRASFPSAEKDPKMNKIIQDFLKQEGLDNNHVAYYTYVNNTWSIMLSDGLSSTTSAQGNTNQGAVTNAIQDYHKADPMHFEVSGSIVNATRNAVDGAVEIMNVPDPSDGVSQFPVQMYKPAYLVGNAEATKNAVILYRYQFTDLVNAHSSFNASQWVTADQVTDWSKVKSVAVYFSKGQLPAYNVVRLVLPVYDPHVYDHPEKSVKVTSAIFSIKGVNNGLPTRTIDAKSTAAATVTVRSYSKISIWLHYKDINGKDQMVDLGPNYVMYLRDGVDSVNDRLAIINQAVNYARSRARNVGASGIIVDNVDHYINSSDVYEGGYKNDVATSYVPGTADPAISKYYFNNDRFVLDGFIPVILSKTDQVTETIHYRYSDGRVAAPDFVRKTPVWTRHYYHDPYYNDDDWLDSGNDFTYEFRGAPAPIIKGFATVESTTDNTGATVKTPGWGHADYETTFTYAPLGHIIPVDENGNEIPGAAHPQYINNPCGNEQFTWEIQHEMPTPTVAGYIADQATVNISTSDRFKDTKVVYHRAQSSATIDFIDQDEDNKLLNEHKVTGLFGLASTETTADLINQYKKQGYLLVSDETDGKPIVFTQDTKTYKVVLKHATSTSTVNHVKHLVVSFVYQTGTTTAYVGPDYHGKDITFTDTIVTDLVTNQVKSKSTKVFGAMKVDSGDPSTAMAFFDNNYPYPKMNGYHPVSEVHNPYTTENGEDTVRDIVYYEGDPQGIEFQYYDDTNKVLIAGEAENGVSDGLTFMTTGSKIAEFIKKGYVLVSDDTHGEHVRFDHDDNVDQIFWIHFKHATNPVNDQKTYHRIITIEDPHKGNSDEDQVVTITRKGTYDKVTGKTTWDTWTPGELPSYVPPKVPGYTSDTIEVKNSPIDPDKTPAVDHIHIQYHADAQKLLIKYILMDGLQVGDEQEIDGVTDQVVDLALRAPWSYIVIPNIAPKTYKLSWDTNELDVLVAPVRNFRSYKTGDADLIRKVYRLIDITRPDYTHQTVMQTVTFVRNAWVDRIGLTVGYTGWLPLGNGYFKSYVPEIIDGYIGQVVKDQKADVNQNTVMVKTGYDEMSSYNRPIYIDANGQGYDELPIGYEVAVGQTADSGSMLVIPIKDPMVVKPLEFVTRTITVTMPDGNVKTVKQKAVKNGYFSKAYLPQLKGFKTTVNGNIDRIKASNDMTASVVYSRI